MTSHPDPPTPVQHTPPSENGRRLRPYSLKLFLLSIPVSYLVFMALMWGVGGVADPAPGHPSLWSSFVVVSMWYGLSCYAWIPLTWISISVTTTIAGRRKP
ncbi:hypothetical protein GTV32_16205 [Gordonia sp. SID5947]|uniref:hypothetical protein n=1 Tax=Gordonia sp. SID5947 TaxID=2690315 RepID=UPI00136B3B09|nr:hypothetical protein [Gordonia sp. SID5947]MYR07748.1 hypothetical protein [Gordonia sp. SID5947]